MNDKDIDQPSSSQIIDKIPDSADDKNEMANLVLWPDASVYSMPINNCIKRPRYLQIPENTTGNF